ncbi:TP901 family phage tail tape measure protein [Azospirillum brasilense]|uniref:TP901 family phage tail tape measure protein n=1 Tax=Azospirillum brasilense TaxID=192 RepID=A0A560BSQ6_AZOBR|nr:phage tail tape measure protein [Azospirillum brasilense]TWA75636.1 TP901 family phage tail tape measure protein [Azospirillum brasilense]
MTNKLKIEVTASDKAGGAIDGLGKKITGLNSIASKTDSIFGKIDRSVIGSGRTESAVGRTASALSTLGHGLSSARRGIVETAGALGVLDGAMGIAAGAGSVSAVALLVERWGRAGVATANSAAAIGVLPGRLRTLQGAATLAGLSAEDMTGSMRGLATTLQDAAFGRNNEAAAMLNTLGIVTRRTKDGAVDAEAAMGDLAEAIARQTAPQTQAKIAQIFGVEVLLPMLRRGRAGWNAYIKDIERLAEVSEKTQKESENLGDSLGRLRAAVSGVGVTIEGRLAGRLTPIIDEVTSFTAANRDAIATWATLTAGIGIASKATSIAAKLAGRSALAARAGTALTGPIGGAIVAGTLAYELTPEENRKVTVRRETEDEKKVRESSWWPSWLPSITFNSSVASKAPPRAISPAKPIVDAVPAPIVSGSTRVPLGIRQNNPGNLRRWGDAPIVGGFARFNTPEEGLAAAARNLLTYQDKHGINTLGGIANRWAPAGDGNDPAAYARSLSEQTGILPNQPLDLRDRDTLAPLLSAIIRQENGVQPYTPQQVEQAVKVTIEMSGDPPPGMKVTAENAPGSNGPAPRVEYSMQSWATP